MESSDVGSCLQNLGVTDSDEFFEGCSGVNEEFSRIKKAYFKRVLATHPDKGGDAEEFRRVQTSFEVLRGVSASSYPIPIGLH